MRGRFVVAAAALAALAACAPTTQGPTVSKAEVAAEARLQKELAWNESRSHFIRLNRLFLPLAVAALPLCPDDRIAYEYGYTFLNYEDVVAGYKDVAGKVEGLGRLPKILDVLAHSAAEKAGLKPGDEIIEISGHPMTGEKGSMPRIQEIAAKHLEKKEAVHLTVLRDGAAVKLTINAEPFCNFPPILDQADDTVNAWADGKNVLMTGGMMRFAQEDDELALVLAHELAHNLKSHMAAQTINQAAGAIAGTLADVLIGGATGMSTRFGRVGGALGAMAYSQQFEAEADYIGLYLMARAGLPIESAPKFWRRMGARAMSGISHGTSHPPTAYRFAALSQTVAEIKDKTAKSLPLLPNSKGAQPLKGNGDTMDLPSLGKSKVEGEDE